MEKHPERKQDMEKEKKFKGAIIIMYKNINGKRVFLVVENAKSRNISFVSGGEEDSDGSSLEQTAQREIEEELGLRSASYQLTPTELTHDFIFNSNKPERAGKEASYKVYLADASDVKDGIVHTAELKSADWMTQEQVQTSLTFPDLKEIFEKAISLIES